MSLFVQVVLAGLAGIALGLFFFGGLWWTVRRMPASARPALLAIASFVVRVAVACAGFLLVGTGDYRRMIACLVGFVLARVLLARRLGTAERKEARGGAHP